MSALLPTQRTNKANIYIISIYDIWYMHVGEFVKLVTIIGEICAN